MRKIVLTIATVGMGDAFVCPVAQAAEDLIATRDFCESTQKFDQLLRQTKSSEDLIKLCDQYAAKLKTMTGPDAENSKFLGEAIKREISRVDQVKIGWLESPEKFARVRLDSTWIKGGQYKEVSADFRKVLGLKAKHAASEFRPDLREGFGEGAVICGKPWLCPLIEFVESIAGVKGLRANTARILVGMDGYPYKNFYYHSYDGDFNKQASAPGGRFNRMYVVTDSWDQVVAVQFTCESPKDGRSYAKDPKIGIFNFLEFRRKGSSSGNVKWNTSKANGMTKIHTLFTDAAGLKEINVLFLPQPVFELLSFNLGQS